MRWYHILILYVILILCPNCDPMTVDQVFFDEDIQTIAQYIDLHPEEYSSFGKVMEAANIRDALSSYNPFGNNFTLFLPTNDAFEAFINENASYATLDDLLEDVDFVRELARYHVVNQALQTNEFAYGALPDTTGTGDYLTIGFSQSYDSTVYKVNNEVPIIIPNIEVVNGYIHIIDGVLKPIDFSSFDWIKQNEGFSILLELFEQTGIMDTMGIFRMNTEGELSRNKYTLLAEHDSVYHKQGIFSFDDLVESIDPNSDAEYTDPDNSLYKFAAYHLLEGGYFLDELYNSGNYNTYTVFPIRVTSGLEIKINEGSNTYATLIEGTDTTIIDYLRVLYEQSNVLTKNGAIHFLQDILRLYKPPRSSRTFQFLEEPKIRECSYSPNTYEFLDPEDFEYLSWEGAESIQYYKSSSSSESASNDDYLFIDEIFTIQYQIPKILPGNYNVIIRVNAQNSNNATIQLFIDGRRVGRNFDLTSGGDPYDQIYAGVVNFSLYEHHQIVIKSLIPGNFIWDYIRFEPS